MRFLNLTNIRKRGKLKKQELKILVCLFFTFLVIFNFIYVNGNYFGIKFSDDNLSNKNNDNSDAIFNNLKTTSATSMLQDPFTENFTLLRNFFTNKYQSNLDFEVDLYYRYGDQDGDILDSTIFSEDNLLYYNSLMKMEIDDIQTYEIYLDLKDTTLWYNGDINEFKYGFVKSIGDTTGELLNNNRSLIDNLLPIFLLIENIGAEIDIITVSGTTPRQSINEMFYLINSSEFWDDRFLYNGFFSYNSSDTKHVESNFYSILANLLIHRTYKDLGLDSVIQSRAYELANLTMNDINTYMWDSADNAFYHRGNENWAFTELKDDYYYLSTNALGIITLLEFWLATGMENDSTYLKRAIRLYDSLDSHFWNDTINLYKRIVRPDWSDFDNSLNLNDNALMMSACLKFFEVTGNLTYYSRALEIYKSIQNNLYDKVNHAYDFSFTNSTKSFNSNLKLSKAYLNAFEIYNNTVLNVKYNVSGEVPSFILNQDVMNLTSTYSFRKIGQYYNPENESYGRYTVQHDITNYSINYIFKYPNGTFFYQFDDIILDPKTSYALPYEINETLPIIDGYYIYVWANATYFKLTNTLKRFNVISGLISESIEGLPGILYQGPIVNVSLFLNYTRNDNLTLTASIVGQDIVNYPSQEINFTSIEEIIQIDFNLTSRFGAELGSSEIFFRIKKGSIIYLEIKEVIEIGYSFDYSNLLYQDKVVKGENIFVSINLKNFLPNATQTLNVSFTGITENCIEEIISEESLSEKEIVNVVYYLKTLESILNDTIRIEMKISINTTEYYSKKFTVEIMPKFEIISATFPQSIPQGDTAYLIIIIQNNQEISEAFSLYINNVKFGTNIAELNTGENIIVAKIVPTINPYEFGIRSYRVKLTDSQDQEIALFYFETSLELSTLNLILFYLLPIIVPIGIILYFKNKDIKHKKLRR